MEKFRMADSLHARDHQSCAVIGAGIIGICCGIALQERGLRVTIFDPEAPGSMTSSGNAGGFAFTDVLPLAGPGMFLKIPGWLFDPYGPLSIRPGHLPALMPWLIRFVKVSSPAEVNRLSLAMAGLMKSGYTDTRKLVNRAGLESLFTELGAITVYKNRKSFEKDRHSWHITSQRGVAVQELGRGDIRELEPQLRNAQYGWYTPQWCSTTDPLAYARGLADFFVGNGGNIVRKRVMAVNAVPAGQSRDGHVESLALEQGEKFISDHYVLAAGIWSKMFCQQLGERVLLESERGYNTTLPMPGIELKHHVTFGEEMFVVSNIRGGLRIGGAVELAGLDAPPNFRRSARLIDIARRYLPDLDATGSEQWMGHRPATPDTIPVIGPSPAYTNLHYAFGHGHYGLTMAATTARLVAQSITGNATDVDLTPYSISRFF